MNKKTGINFSRIIFVVLLILVMYSISMTYIIQHEAVHYKIFERYGVHSKVTLSWLVSGIVEPNPSEFYLCNDYCKLSHGLNDIISYSTALIIMTAFIIYILNLIKNSIKRDDE